MGKKKKHKRKAQTTGPNRWLCFYCDREFKNEAGLVEHQGHKHYSECDGSRSRLASRRRLPSRPRSDLDCSTHTPLYAAFLPSL